MIFQLFHLKSEYVLKETVFFKKKKRKKDKSKNHEIFFCFLKKLLVIEMNSKF